MIDITRDIKNGTTTVVEYREDALGDIVTTQVSVTKKKVKTAKGDFETIRVLTTPSSSPLDESLKLLKVLEVVG
nr:MAG TPA: hypothetical protein [Caudoviricetes sp.]